MTAHRRNAAFVDPLERRFLAWLVVRLPTAVTPDMLTAVGFVGALCTMAGYALASLQPAMLALASVGLALNWFGDSLDGTLARWRRIERPRYGFFLDNAVDIVEQGLLAVGIGLSGYVGWGLAAGVLASFFMLSLLSLLRAQVHGVFDIALAGIGLTEIRCLLIVANILLFLYPPRSFAMLGLSLTYADLLAVSWLVGNLATFLTIAVQELRRLRIEDRQPWASRTGDRPS